MIVENFGSSQGVETTDSGKRELSKQYCGMKFSKLYNKIYVTTNASDVCLQECYLF